ncbi:MAG TPA: response regulator transcription factor [Gemmatimonadaceae bacterium]|nr:response regulator transcription factor [Gemmatimonadaceae bacterium]
MQPLPSDSGTHPVPDRRAAPAGVLVLSPVRLLRDGLVELLARRPGSLAPCGVATLDDALGALADGCSRVVLVDAGMGDAPSLARRLERHPGVRALIAIAVSPDDVASQVTLAECGVRGYVSHEGSMDDLLAATDAALRGELHCPPRVAAALARRLASVRTGQADGVNALSHREREIVQLVDSGMSNKEIASRLHIEMATVKNHMHHILHKLGVQRRGEAAAVLRRWKTA